jgi:hypothetical protein
MSKGLILFDHLLFFIIYLILFVFYVVAMLENPYHLSNWGLTCMRSGQTGKGKQKTNRCDSDSTIITNIDINY